MAATDKDLTIVIQAKNLAKKELARLNRQIGGVAGAVEKYNVELRGASKVLAGMSIVGAGVFVKAITVAGEFEQALANVSAVTKATAEEQRLLKESALDMGAKSVFSASQAAEAQLFLGQAGQSTSEIIASLGGVMDLAAATSADLGFAAEVTAATLSQFGLKAAESARVANVFAASASASQATINKLAFAMRQAGPVANSLGLSLEETTASLNLLFNAGFKGEQAGTILRNVLTGLAKPTTEASELLEELGIQVTDSSGKMLPFIQIIRQLEKANINTAQAIALFGKEAGPGFITMLQAGSVALENMTKKITDTDEAARQAKVRMDNLFGSLTQLKSAVEVAAITIGDEFIPAIRVVTETITEWVRAFNDLDAPIQALIANSALTVVAITGMIGALGLFATGTAGVVMGMKKMGITVGRLIALFGKFALVIATFNLAWDFGKWLNGFALIRKGMAHVMEFIHTGILGLGLAWDALILGLANGIKSLVDLLPGNAFFDAVSGSLGSWIKAHDEGMDESIKKLQVVKKNWEDVRKEIEKQGDTFGQVAKKTKALNEVMQDSHVKAFQAARKQLSIQEDAIANTERHAKAVYDLAEADLKVLKAEQAITTERMKSAKERTATLKGILDAEADLKSFMGQMDEKGLSQTEKDKSELIRQEETLAKIIMGSTNERIALLREVRFLEGEEKQAVLKKLQEATLKARVEELGKVVKATRELALSAEKGSDQETKASDIAIESSKKLKDAMIALGIVRGRIDAEAIKSGQSIQDQYKASLKQVAELEAQFDSLKEKIKDIKATITIADQDKLMKEAHALRKNIEAKFAPPIVQKIILQHAQAGNAVAPVFNRGRVVTTRSAAGISVRGFASGLNRVPYDNFPALLHRGERVQTASQVNQKNDQRPITITFGDIVLANGDPEEFVREVAPLMREAIINLDDRIS